MYDTAESSRKCKQVDLELGLVCQTTISKLKNELKWLTFQPTQTRNHESVMDEIIRAAEPACQQIHLDDN